MNKTTVISYAYAMNTATELTQKLTKSMPGRQPLRIFTREKYLCKNSGVKEREGACSKGAYGNSYDNYLKGKL